MLFSQLRNSQLNYEKRLGVFGRTLDKHFYEKSKNFCTDLPHGAFCLTLLDKRKSGVCWVNVINWSTYFIVSRAVLMSAPKICQNRLD